MKKLRFEIRIKIQISVSNDFKGKIEKNPRYVELWKFA